MQYKASMKCGIYRHRIVLAALLCLYSLLMADAQQKGTGHEQPKKTRIDLLHAEIAHANKYLNPDITQLKGDVRFRHDSMYMYCDSALINTVSNSVDAYGNIRMEQGDTLFIYGDYMHYDGMTQIAMLRENVKMINRANVLTTDSLNYDRILNKGYYFDGGKLTDEENVLTSVWGEYSPATKIALFNEEVVLVNPKFKLNSDTLKYSTITKVATILGPSHIVSEKNHIYSEKGWYDTVNDRGYLLDRSYLENEAKRLTGDSIFYDRKKGFGEAFGKVLMNDTVNKKLLKSNYTFYNELKGDALANDRAVLVDYSEPSDSLFVHGDTIRLKTFNLNTDSVYREFRIYHKVRAYKESAQAVCDSLVYNSKDSCMVMYDNPVLWSGRQQLLGEQINVYMNDSTIDWAHIINQALAVEQVDSIHFNQLGGKEMKAYFLDNELHKVDVNGNVQVVYYQHDDKDSTVIMGMNFAEGGLLKMEFRDRKMYKAAFVGKANGTFYPLEQTPADKQKLTTFVWLDEIRPKSKEDIFVWRGKSEDEMLKKSDREMVSPRKIRIKRNRR